MNPPFADAIAALANSIDVALIEGLTCSLIEAPSINPGGTEAAAVAVLAQACRDVGLSVSLTEAAPDRPNLLASTATSTATGPGVLFLGHTDVVPAGPGWTGDPFVARRDGDLIIGRGSSDMKGGLAAVVAALAALSRAAEFGIDLSGPVHLLATVDEEEHGSGVRAVVADPPPLEFAACIVAEPTCLEVVRGCRGASYLDVDITGRAAHSGRPSDGRSAIEAAAAVIGLIGEDQAAMAADPHPLLGFGTWNVGVIDGGQGISVVAPNCSLGVDRRLMPGESIATIASDLADAISAAGIDDDGITVRLTPTMEMPGFDTPADAPLVRAAVDAVIAAGAPTSVGGWTAACDGGFISRDLGVPTVVLGPGDINGQAHQPDESVPLAELVTAARAYVYAAVALLT
ncbi:MAG: M20/M25/M40 family metallo-hydrolase [Gordonia sp. (in: high G+C Gram-positive bacteria)]|uniref:M20 family metallopeptidase n=1 Tax=Gordonia sp. (in: high G+C Gram-positive bacteria) TaxID=84139 RepID=UPI003BB49FC8